ncbi:MAG: DNA polymerase III subunit gamma/tau, partial [Clostridia bacterium]|nr:DNA polymerase III subunit gamma/tau [Clostridia bacterium]
GQEHITTALKNEIRSDRLAHAYLFVGSRGTGKTSCAKILAKAVNCLHPVDGDPCGECEICRGIDDGSIMDVTELDAASNNGVDYVRELREEVAYMPAVAKYRVYIIDEVHMMTDSAFNALLKTLEEPPAHVIFVLATTEVQELPDTILSRCQRFDFGRITVEEITSRIQHIAEQETFSITEDAAQMLARLADGGLRDALSLLDQCVSHTETITLDTVTETAGLAGRDHMYELSKAVRSHDGGSALDIIDRLHNASKDMERLCSECLDFFRQMMICKQVKNPDKLIVLPAAELKHLQEEADAYNLADILHCLDVLQHALRQLRAGAARRLEMEMAFMKLCNPVLDGSMDAVLRRMKTIEDAVRSGQVVSKAEPVKPKKEEKSETKSKTVEKTEEPKESSKPQEPEEVKEENPVVSEEEEDEFLQWNEVLDTLTTECPPLYGALADTSAKIQGDHVVVLTSDEMVKSILKKDGNAKYLIKAIASVTGKEYRIGLKTLEKEGTKNDIPDSPLTAFIKENREKGLEFDVRGES